MITHALRELHFRRYAQNATQAQLDEHLRKLGERLGSNRGTLKRQFQLPANYMLWYVPRPGEKKDKKTPRHDEFLYGHSNQYAFRSFEEFLPYLRYLSEMTKNGEAEKCTCRGCK